MQPVKDPFSRFLAAQMPDFTVHHDRLDIIRIFFFTFLDEFDHQHLKQRVLTLPSNTGRNQRQQCCPLFIGWVPAFFFPIMTKHFSNASVRVHLPHNFRRNVKNHLNKPFCFRAIVLRPPQRDGVFLFAVGIRGCIGGVITPPIHLTA